jgi:hypothetical protein
MSANFLVSPLLTRGVLAVQSLYYLITGLWPLFSIGTFQAVTGPKRDLWLVKTVGVLVSVIGAVLAVAAWRPTELGISRLLAIGASLGLSGIDIVYVSKGRIPKIYLLDALLELKLAGLLIASWIYKRRMQNELIENIVTE